MSKFPIAPDIPIPPALPKNPILPNNYHVYYNGERIMVITADRMRLSETGQIFLEYRCSCSPVAIIPASHMVLEVKPSPASLAPLTIDEAAVLRDQFGKLMGK